jgi:hypothetical protein
MIPELEPLAKMGRHENKPNAVDGPYTVGT